MPSFVKVEDVIAYGDLSERKINGAVFETVVSSAERFVQRYTRRQFAPLPALDANGADTGAPVSKTYAVTRGRRFVRIADLRTATSVAIDGSTLLVDTGYQIDNYAEPATSLDLLYPYGFGTTYGSYITGVNPYGTGKLVITGRWGWNPVPEDVVTAVWALSLRMWKERDAAWADSIALPDGSVLSYFRQLPASIQGGLNNFKLVNLAIV